MLKRWNKRCQIYKLTEGVTFSTPFKGISYIISHLSLNEDGLLDIKERYEWNGCSPKIEIFGTVFGTPEGAIPTQKVSLIIERTLGTISQSGMVAKNRRTFYASLIHDCLYQIAEDHADSLDRGAVDKIFLDLLKIFRFRPAKLYYAVVRLLGGLFWGKKS